MSILFWYKAEIHTTYESNLVMLKWKEPDIVLQINEESKWLLYNAKYAIFQLYHWQNKQHDWLISV